MRKILISGLVLLFLFSGCGGKDDKLITYSSPGNTVDEVDIDLSPVQNEGVVSFLTGDVMLVKADGEVPAEIGDTLGESDGVRTGPGGFCEIQVAGTAIISIQESSQFFMETVNLGEQGKVIKGRLSRGTVAFKITKLLSGDRFSVETPTTACAVRGTRFLMTVDENQNTGVAVDEGSVAVSTPSAARLEEIQSEVPEDLSAAIDSILESEILVDAGSEIVVQKEDLESIEEKLRDVVAEVTRSVEASETDNQALIQALEERALELTAVEPLKSVPISAEKQEILKPLEDRKFLVIPLAGKSVEEKAEPVRYQALIVNVQPDQASIFIDGEFRGTGSISVLLPVSSEHELQLRAEGFEGFRDNVAIPENSSTSYSYTLEPRKEEISIIVEPGDTVLFLNGEELGTGSHKGSYRVGDVLKFAGRRDGYNPAGIEVRVEEGGQTEYEMVLGRGLRPFVLQVSPEDAVIEIDGREIRGGRFEGEYEFGASVQVRIRKDGYKIVERDFILDESVSNETEVTLELADVELNLRARPPKIRFSINGEYVGQGNLGIPLDYGSEVEILAEHEGYESQRFVVFVDQLTPITREVNLVPLALYGRYSLGSQALVGSPALAGNRLVVADENGVLHSLNLETGHQWSQDTGNRSNEASSPVFAGNRVILAGKNRFVALNANSGSEVFGRDLGALDALPFGNQPIYASSEIIYPLQNGLGFYSPNNFGEIGLLTLPEMLVTTPAHVDGRVYIVDFSGTLHAVSISDREILWSSPTPFKQPAGAALALRDGKGYMGDTKGTAACFNLENGKILWTANLPSRITTTAALSQDWVHIWSGDQIHILSRATGKESRNPIPDVTTPPIVEDDRLYFGTGDGSLVVQQASSGSELYRYSLGGRPSTAVMKFRSLAAVGLETGELVVVNEEAFLQ